MVDEHVQGLLDAEARARELVTVLESLRKEIESYGTARLELQKAGGGLAHACERLGALAADAAAVLATLKALGTPEIISAVEASREASAAGLRDVQGGLAHLSTVATAGFEAAHESLAGAREQVERVAAFVRQCHEGIAATLESVNAGSADNRRGFTAVGGSLEAAKADVLNALQGIAATAAEHSESTRAGFGQSREQIARVMDRATDAVGRLETLDATTRRVERWLWATGGVLVVVLALLGWSLSR